MADLKGSNVSAFTRYKLNDIPEALRLVASQIELGQINCPRVVLIIECEDGDLDYKAFGQEPFTYAHAAGLCFAAAKEIVS